MGFTPRLVGVLLVGAALSACGGADPGETLPAVDLNPLGDEAALSLDEIEGPAVINLWQTFCAPCVKELPAFQQVADAHPEIAFYGINIGEDASTAKPFLDDLGITYDQYLDVRGDVSIELKVNSMPTTIVLDADSKVSTRHRGAMSVDDLLEAISDVSSLS